MVTIKDIAEKAGVSYATVSRAFKKDSEINDKTRERILQIATEIGYRPNAVARSLVTKKTNTIAILVPDISNPFFAELSLSLSSYAEAKGYGSIIGNTNWNKSYEDDRIHFMYEKRVDGIILKSVNSVLSSTINSIDIPLVLIAQSTDADISFVDMDAIQGGYLGTKHLIQCGYKNIVFLSGVKNSYTAQLRVKGYKKALEEAGYAFDEKMCINGQYTIDSGYTCMNILLKQKSIKVDAVFCGSDIIALGALKSLKEFGICVPDDFGVVGFDDISYASLPQIMLTTISQPRNDLAKKAFNILLGSMKNKKNINKVTLEPKLIIRETTRKGL